jgi:Holliday junction DNA helicase RuvA
MIASLHGEVRALTLSSAVIEVGGVGMLVQIPSSVAADLRLGTPALLHTTLVVREDALTLYGFASISSRELFELLQTVTGIGPKVALSALSLYTEEALIDAIANENSAALEKIPGLGKKSASRILLELHDKVSANQSVARSPASPTWRNQLHEALLSLGFSAREADQSIDIVAEELGAAITTSSVGDLLRMALAQRGRK